MRSIKPWIVGITAIGVVALSAASLPAATLNFVGTQFDIGGTFFPGGGPADVQSYVVVPWRSDSANNTFAVSTASPNRYYGSAGYALFATTFTYPNANATPGNANVPIAGDASFQNLSDLPSWVTGSEVIATRIAGGFAYALVDHPELTAGIRDFNWGDSQVPPAMPEHSQPPYLKIGVITGDPLNNRLDPGGNRDRWAFTVGAGVPNQIRIGVMTDGLDNSSFAPEQVFLRQDGGDWVSSDVMPIQNPGGRNRFVDLSFFDIVGAQPGDTFIMSGTDFGRVSGFSFDVVPEPGSFVLAAGCFAALFAAARRRRAAA